MIAFGPVNEAHEIVPPDLPVAWFGSDLPTLLRDVLRPGDVFVDVGAKNGVASTLIGARLVGTGGRVLALEPDPARFARLMHNVALNRIANALCFPVAASDETIHATLYRDVPHGHITAPGRHIRVQRVDALCEKFAGKPVRLVRIDAPGAELLALRGMSKLLGREMGPIVLCQISKWTPQALNSDRDALINHMVDHGYVPKQIGPTHIARPPGQSPHVRFTLLFSKAHASALRTDAH